MRLKKIVAIIIPCAVAAIIPYSCKTQKAVMDCSAVEATYSKDIAPIVLSNCMPCHKSGSTKGDFTTYDGLNSVATSGELKEKVLIRQEMPPNGPLSEDLRKKIGCWLNNGHPNN